MCGGRKLKLILDWPPSVNHYWMTRGKYRYISKRGVLFQKHVASKRPPDWEALTGRVEVTVDAYPPDKRKRDLDNLGKALFDSLETAGVYLDDNQIDRILLVRREVRKPGMLEVVITEVK